MFHEPPIWRSNQNLIHIPDPNEDASDSRDIVFYEMENAGTPNMEYDLFLDNALFIEGVYHSSF